MKRDFSPGLASRHSPLVAENCTDARHSLFVNTALRSAADIVKMAMVEVYRKLSEKFPTARLLLQVHDELIAECDEKDAPAVAALMKETMEHIITLDVPLRVSVEYGKNWGEFH